MKLLISESHDPFYNQSVENYLYDNFSNEEVLFLWINRPSLFLGRHQNPLKELNIPLLKKNNIPLLRRISGGGTVFHDLGNINFSFITNNTESRKKMNLEFVIKLLSHYGITAKIGERQDLWVSDKKISGSAFKENNKKLLHHFTLLVNSNLDQLGSALVGSDKIVESKGVESNRSPVINLSSIVSTMNVADILNRISILFGSDSYSWESFSSQLNIEKYHNKFKSEEWFWHSTPTFKITYNNKILNFDRESIKKDLINFARTMSIS